jgi:hypothetical protein
MHKSATMISPLRPAFVAAASLLCALGLACDQPKPKCTSAHGNFAATYTLVSGDGACAELTSGVLNVQSYNDQTSESDKRLDPNKPTLAIQAQEATDILSTGRESDGKPYAFGAFDGSEPNGKGVCTVSSLSKAVLQAPATDEVPEMMVDECTTEPAMPAQPAVDIGYKWSNVRVVVTPDAIGTKLEADLTYTVDGCSAKYKVAAVWPAIECGSPVEGGNEPDDSPPADDEDDDAGTDPATDPGDAGCPVVVPEPPPPELEADDDICETQGAIPDLALSCDPSILRCVLDE